jgi:hypothetical protein
MSSRHAEHCGEYPGVACVATRRLLASRFASQFQAATAAGNIHSLTSMPGGTVVSVTGDRCFCAHSVDICVEVSQVVVPQALTPYSESADDSDVRAIKHSEFLLRASGLSTDARRAAEYE